MVNTRVKNPAHRTINRKIDRQKRARRLQNHRTLLDPLDDDAKIRASVHELKIMDLKKEREALREASLKQSKV